MRLELTLTREENDVTKLMSITGTDEADACKEMLGYFGDYMDEHMDDIKDEHGVEDGVKFMSQLADGDYTVNRLESILEKYFDIESGEDGPHIYTLQTFV